MHCGLSKKKHLPEVLFIKCSVFLVLFKAMLYLCVKFQYRQYQSVLQGCYLTKSQRCSVFFLFNAMVLMVYI